MYPYIDILGRQVGLYGVCMVLGFFLVGFLGLRRGKPHGFCVEDLMIVAAVVFGCAVLAGGLMYVFVTYPFEQIMAFIRQGNFSFLTSGIVFYGGLIGGILGALLGVRIAKTDMRLVEHSLVPFVPLGHAIGRIGCLMAGCCYGFEYDGPLALHYPHSITGADPNKSYFPVQPLESLVNVGICIALLAIAKKVKHRFGLLAWYLTFYAISRFGLEMLRGDAIRGVWKGFSTSQYISMALLALCGLRLLFIRLYERKKASAN